mmetsp:Transcript_70320/g.168500  ORF Transcript_70320/g.168500 Transcript_70320/m.168500 type:complete len:94 (+) Transcript_70320:1877-2158(+)
MREPLQDGMLEANKEGTCPGLPGERSSSPEVFMLPNGCKCGRVGVPNDNAGDILPGVEALDKLVRAGENWLIVEAPLVWRFQSEVALPIPLKP